MDGVDRLPGGPVGVRQCVLTGRDGEVGNDAGREGFGDQAGRGVDGAGAGSGEDGGSGGGLVGLPFQLKDV